MLCRKRRKRTVAYVNILVRISYPASERILGSWTQERPVWIWRTVHSRRSAAGDRWVCESS